VGFLLTTIFCPMGLPGAGLTFAEMSREWEYSILPSHRAESYRVLPLLQYLMLTTELASAFQYMMVISV